LLNYSRHVKKVFGALCLAVIFASAPVAHATVSQQGNSSQSISIKSATIAKKSTVTVIGRNFDETVGIYLAYCVVPKSGKAPTPCGGGINKDGVGNSSLWISSNAPPYADGLAEPFLPGGRFTKQVLVSKKIGAFDCTKVKCAITVRADHLREGDRTHDLFIPITFKNQTSKN
jgi:hypothetical protein